MQRAVRVARDDGRVVEIWTNAEFEVEAVDRTAALFPIVLVLACLSKDMPSNNQVTGHIYRYLKCLGVCYIHTSREPSVGSWLVGVIAEHARFGKGADVVFGVIGPCKGFITIAWSC